MGTPLSLHGRLQIDMTTYVRLYIHTYISNLYRATCAIFSILYLPMYNVHSTCAFMQIQLLCRQHSNNHCTLNNLLSVHYIQGI